MFGLGARGVNYMITIINGPRLIAWFVIAWILSVVSDRPQLKLSWAKEEFV